MVGWGQKGADRIPKQNWPDCKFACGHSLLKTTFPWLHAAHPKLVCISIGCKQWRIVCLALKDALGYSLPPRAYINILIICCFGGGHCICLMSEITPYSHLEVILMWFWFWGHISLVNVLEKLFCFLLSGPFYIRLDFMCSEDWILVYLSLGSSQFLSSFLLQCLCT